VATTESATVPQSIDPSVIMGKAPRTPQQTIWAYPPPPTCYLVGKSIVEDGLMPSITTYTPVDCAQAPPGAIVFRYPESPPVGVRVLP
jgi:hypothetical protein